MRRRFWFIIGLFIAGTALSAEEPRYFFYRAVKGDVTLYLLGSMHMGRPGDADYPEKIYSALKESRLLILEGEVRKDKIRTPDMSLTYLPAGKTITSFLTPDEKKQLEKVCEKLGVRLETFERFEPWFLEFMFGYRMAFNQGFVLEYGTEHRLLRYIEKKMPAASRPGVFALEASDEVLRTMHTLPLAAQLKRFRTFLAYSDKAAGSTAPEMQESWRNGDDSQVLKIFNYYYDEKESESGLFVQKILYDRNARMAERLGLVARYAGQYFFVTGAMHLIGEKSILTHLRKAGFKVERL